MRGSREPPNETYCREGKDAVDHAPRAPTMNDCVPQGKEAREARDSLSVCGAGPPPMTRDIRQPEHLLVELVDFALTGGVEALDVCEGVGT
jgi:hypothetical protein